MGLYASYIFRNRVPVWPYNVNILLFTGTEQVKYLTLKIFGGKVTGAALAHGLFARLLSANCIKGRQKPKR